MHSMKSSKSKRLLTNEFEMEEPNIEYDGLDTGQMQTRGNQRRTYIVPKKFKNLNPSTERRADPYPQEVKEEGHQMTRLKD